ncbi:hypothetical protein IV203_002028 [Nitzschia inconspicua]|uniref:Uncharacterized protein n=1 Tax=Nitzschia inconspicua TaxID=303405 RepID=A0A9K3PRL1_9STRA|nr:hypothetical protein IV203_002028 [Nitzschia inconspicua]
MTKTVRFAGQEDGFWSSSSAHSSFSSLDESSATNYLERCVLPPRLPIRKVSYCDLPDDAFSEDEEEVDLASPHISHKKKLLPPTILRKKSRYSSPPPPPPPIPCGDRHRRRQLGSVLDGTAAVAAAAAAETNHDAATNTTLLTEENDSSPLHVRGETHRVTTSQVLPTQTTRNNSHPSPLSQPNLSSLTEEVGILTRRLSLEGVSIRQQHENDGTE